MLQALFGRLLSRTPAPLPPPPIAPRARPAPIAASPLAGPALGARRPLVSTQGALAGFEFHVSPAMVARLLTRNDGAAAKACTAGVLAAMRLCAGQRLITLAELPSTWLAAGAADDAAFVPGMHLVLRPPWPAAEVLTALLDSLRRAGVRAGVRPADAAPIAAPDFIVPDAAAQADLPRWHAALRDSASRWPDVPLVLLDLPNIDLLEAVLAPPVALAACALGAENAPASPTVLAPQAQRLMQLLGRLVRDDDNAVLVASIKADAALSLRLLQMMNSAGASPGRELDSIDQAVMVLGRAALYGWVSQMLVRLSPPRPAAEGLQALALARARLLESLARAAADASPGSLYLLGLASMLPQLLNCSIDSALASLQLPPQATEALRDHAGPWHRYLVLARALEKPDLAAAEMLATSFGGLSEVLTLSARAWSPA